MRAKNGIWGKGVAYKAGIEERDMVLAFLPAHFHHIFEQLRFRQSSVGSIFLSAGESWKACLGQSWVRVCRGVPHSHSGGRIGNRGM